MPLFIPFSGRSGTPEQSLVAGVEELAAGDAFREYRSILALSALLFMFNHHYEPKSSICGKDHFLNACLRKTNW